MKVKGLRLRFSYGRPSTQSIQGFQVAPAELEGHLLDHSDVADACVVGIPDEYSGELPFAFVVLKAETAQRVNANTKEAAKVKAAIAKVRSTNCGWCG
jgi:acyl-coenzyme A synthetase/AMP-(fatty) acid ligase